MTRAEFVDRIRIAVYESCLTGTLALLQNPPGRQPSKHLVDLSQWFKQLSPHDREQVEATVRLAVRGAVFGMLCVLDGARSIRDSGERGGALELRYVDEGVSILLNASTDELLHDLFAGKVPTE